MGGRNGLERVVRGEWGPGRKMKPLEESSYGKGTRWKDGWEEFVKEATDRGGVPGTEGRGRPLPCTILFSNSQVKL